MRARDVEGVPHAVHSYSVHAHPRTHLQAAIGVQGDTHAVEPHLEHPPLPTVSVEKIDCTSRIFRACEQNGPETSRPAIGSECDVGAQHRSRAPEEVLEVLPAHAIWELYDGGG